MKFKGQKIINDNVEHVIIPRNGYEIVFIAKPVLTFDEFEEYVKRPEPPYITPAGGEPYPDYEDEKFVSQLQEYAVKQTSWLIINSLKDSPDISWDQVDYTKPETWHLWSEELTEAQFSVREIATLTNAVTKVNGLDDSQLEAAKKRFLAMQFQEKANL